MKPPGEEPEDSPPAPPASEQEPEIGVLEAMHQGFAARIRARKEQGLTEAAAPRAPRGESR